jgi:hypothetical protein
MHKFFQQPEVKIRRAGWYLRREDLLFLFNLSLHSFHLFIVHLLPVSVFTSKTAPETSFIIHISYAQVNYIEIYASYGDFIWKISGATNECVEEPEEVEN